MLVIGVTRTPASAPIAAESAKESVITQLVLMPTSCAASRLFEVASTALPVSVLVKNTQSPAKTASAPKSTQSAWGRMVAPMIWIGVSPVKAGKRWSCLSKTSWATPRMKIQAPMVMMMSDTTGAPRAGSIASLLSATPTPAVATIAASAASGIGRPAMLAKTVIMPPSITNSPWAKFTTSEAL